MREATQDKTRAALAAQATNWVKPLVTLAGGVINGGREADVETIMTHPDPAASPIQPSRPQLAVSAAIFREGKILLVRRARSPGKGFYSLPGGRVEFGESLHAALHREVDEETGLRIEIVGLAGWREVLPGAGGGGHYLIMSFAARWPATSRS